MSQRSVGNQPQSGYAQARDSSAAKQSWLPVFRALPQKCLLLSPQLLVIDATDSFLEITMTSRQNIIGRNIFDVFPQNPDDSHATGMKNMQMSLDKVLASKSSDMLQFQKYDIRRPDTAGGGFEERWWHATNVPILSSSGQIEYIIDTVEDVTDIVRLKEEKGTVDEHVLQLKRLTDDLRAANQKLELFISAVKDYALIMLDPDGLIVSWNDGARRLKGYIASEIIGRHFSVLYTDEDVQAGLPQQLLDQARAEGSVEAEGWRKRKDGSIFWADVLLTAIYRDGKLFGFAKISRDMTEKKRASEEIKQLMDQRENFVAALTHDLKTPILAANRAIELLLDGDFGAVSPAQSEILRTVADSNRSMFGLVALLLDVYRYDSGVKELSKGCQRIDQLVSSVVRQLEPLALKKHLHVNTSFPASLRPVCCDAAEISRVIQNFVSNAFKFTPEAGSVEVEVEQNDENTIVSVKDSGPGIPPELQPGVFKRYYQAPVGGRTQAGSGLGLYLSRSIVESHAGQIGFRSDSKGSTFYFILPNDLEGDCDKTA